MTTDRKTFHWTKDNSKNRAKYPNNPEIPERVERGEIYASERGVEVCPEDDFYYGELSPADSVELAKEILKRHAPDVDVPMKLLIACVECGEFREASFNPYDNTSFTAQLYQELRWFVSIVSPPGSGKVVLAPVCGICAARVLPPELIAEFKRQHGEGGEKPPNVTTSLFSAMHGKKKN